MKPRGKPVKWNPETAYAVGLLTTDGSLSVDGYHIDFTSKDKELVNTFRKCLNLKNKIGRKSRGSEKIKKYYRVQFGNVIFYKWLLNIGLMPNKTKRIGELKVPDKYFFDFLRGHLDGDGCIRVYQDPIYPNSQRVYTKFSSASLKHLKWLQKSIKRLLNIKGYIQKGARVYILVYAKRESLVLLSRLYYNKKTPCLKRKYRIAQPILVKQAGVAELEYATAPEAVGQ